MRREAKCRDAIHNAEVDGLGAVARFLVHGFGGNTEDFAGGEGVDVLVLLVGARQQWVATEVREKS